MYRYIMDQNQRESNRRAVSKYRQKISADKGKKRIEVWVDQPAALDALKQQSGLNQSETVNQLVEIVSDGLSSEFYQNESGRLANAKYMLTRLLEVFQSNV